MLKGEEDEERMKEEREEVSENCSGLQYDSYGRSSTWKAPWQIRRRSHFANISQLLSVEGRRKVTQGFRVKVLRNDIILS